MEHKGHIPVLYQECIDGLSIKPNGIYLDMTVGGFGHGSGICNQLDKNGIYIGMDRDIDAVKRGQSRSELFQTKCLFEHANFDDFERVLNQYNIDKIDGCLMDLGVSSFQIDDASRGFSFMKEGPLDMRMDATQGISAKEVVNTYSEQDLKKIIYDFGEEKFAPSIAKSIVENRLNKEILTTMDLAEIVKQGVPKKFWYKGKHPATKTFQAIRIEVNQELNRLHKTVCAVIDRLAIGGRICIITFHSLEDRIVKKALKEKSEGCICPKDLPVCVCGQEPQIKILTKKPIVPSDEEIETNIRSRSAKLRIAEKLI